ncbi:FAD dependent oxidoreductase [Panaeolus papilionaceus]|nr:FAD dependent oxidoreductase [Panaeolus papilionaceus]
MGGIISTFSFVATTLKTLYGDYESFSTRIALSPGVPESRETSSFWMYPPSPNARYGEGAPLPTEADIVIIGSGITGASVAKTLLEHHYKQYGSSGVKPRTVMLEARELCSGATGRNGGHISPNIYNEYDQLKRAHGMELALQIMRFRLAHIGTLLGIAKAEGVLDDSQARIVEEYDAFMDEKLFSRYKEAVETFATEAPVEGRGFRTIEDASFIKHLQLSSSFIGLISKPGAAIHPYRFVTSILSKLLSNHSNFQIFTNTPCTYIDSNPACYMITTPRGQIKAQHIIHATNAWSSHLVPGMRKKIVPTRLHMSAQRPGRGLTAPSLSPTSGGSAAGRSWVGERAFVFYPASHDWAFDYLTQLLPPPVPDNDTANADSTSTTTRRFPPTQGEFMFGGGATLAGRSDTLLMENIGRTDESADFEIEAYLSGALERYFRPHWGTEGGFTLYSDLEPPSIVNEDGVQLPSDAVNSRWNKSRVKALWTGIMGLSADALPWVGRIPPSISERSQPSPVPQYSDVSGESKTKAEVARSLTPPGEWICAGFSGEGMVHAWLCGRAIAHMVLGVPDEDRHTPVLPSSFLITEQRCRKAKLEDTLTQLSS